MATENDDLKSLCGDLKKAADDVRALHDATQAELKNLGKMTDATKEDVDKALLKHNELSERIDSLEQKAARRGAGDGPAVVKTPGQTVAEDEAVKAFVAAKSRGTIRVNMKAITSLTTDADGSAGDALRPDRRPGILPLPNRLMTVRDLISPGRTNSNAIEYVKETGFTNAAAVVAEGALKPESTLKLDLVTSSVATLAHWVQASKQILDDVAQLQSYVDERLRYGLAYAEEVQLLNGSGTSGNLNGIYTQATAYSAALTLLNPTRVDQLRLAQLQAYNALFPPTGIVLHPTAWASIETYKDSTGQYLFASPQNQTQPRLWGLPVVVTPAMSSTTFLVGAFKLGAQVFDREDAGVELSTEDRDNFIRNLVTIRCEERLALAVYRPEAFIKGTLLALPT